MRIGTSDLFLEDYSFGKDERAGFAVSLLEIPRCRLGQRAKLGTRAEKCPGFVSGCDRMAMLRRGLSFGGGIAGCVSRVLASA